MVLIPAGFAQVTFTFNNGGAPRPAQVTFGIDIPNDNTVEDTLDAMDDVTLTDLVQLTCTNDVTLTNIHVKHGPVVSGPFGDRAVAIVGAQASDTPPSMAALNVVKQTQTGGRRGRGRMFWPGFPENVLLDNGSFDAASLTQFNDAFNDWRTNLDGLLHTMVLLHHSGDPTPSVITSLSVGSRPVTQRRRNRRL